MNIFSLEFDHLKATFRNYTKHGVGFTISFGNFKKEFFINYTTKGYNSGLVNAE